MKKIKPVFDEIGFSKSQSLALIIKSDLLLKIIKTAEQNCYSAKDLQKLLGIPQPRVSELLNGKISSTSIEKLLGYLEKLGLSVALSFKTRKAS